jgi:hypothetical protein
MMREARTTSDLPPIPPLAGTLAKTRSMTLDLAERADHHVGGLPVAVDHAARSGRFVTDPPACESIAAEPANRSSCGCHRRRMD